MDRQRRALALALLPSLAVHALLLSLHFGGLEPGLPSLDLPWRDRRGQAPELQVLLPAPATMPEPAPQIEPPAAEGQAGSASVQVVAPPTKAMTAASEGPPPTESVPAPTGALPSLQPLPELVTLAPPEPTEFSVPAVPPAPPPAAASAAAGAAAISASSPQPSATLAAEAERLETRRLAAARQDAARQAAALEEAARLEAERVETARDEAARLEAERAQSALRDAERREAARVEAERQAAARQEAARLAAARQEAAKAEAARQAAARLEAERLQAARDEEEHRLAVRRAMGRQLDAEAAQRDALANAQRASGALPSSWSSARRGRLFGRADPNAELVLYAEAWARRIQLNTPVLSVQEVARQRHVDPLVTVALRSDGSIESISFVLSSGVPEIDETIRRMVQGLAPHPAFPPVLAHEYDVIEIRRTWHFDAAVHLF